MKLIIFGASGSGTTTVGKTLAKKLSWKHLDADDYYWEKTDPPFQHKLALSERNNWLRKDFSLSPNVIISGSLVTWGTQWEKAFDLGIFLHIPAEIRLARIQTREIERYGEELQLNIKLQQDSKTFLEWAAKYDDPNFEGRSITQHENWIKRLTCPVLQLKGDFSNVHRLHLIENKLDELKGKNS